MTDATASRARRESNEWLRRHAAGIGGRVLSIGSGRDDDGEGRRYREYFRRCASYTTSDIAQEPTCDLILDVQRMPEVADASYDCVFFSGVAEHIPDYLAALSEIQRILVPGGILLLGVPFGQPIHMAPHDFWRFTEYGVMQILKSTSLALIELVAVDESMKGLPSAYWAKAIKPLASGYPHHTRFRCTNTYFDQRDADTARDDVERLRAFDTELGALIDQPEIRDVRKWEYGALLDVVQGRWAGLRVLDVGCGRSLFSAYLQSLGATVVTLDLPAPFQAQEAALHKRRHHGVRHVFGNMLGLPFADGSFDLVVSISAIEHLHEVHGHPLECRPYDAFIRDTATSLVEMARVVAPGGYLFLTSDLYAHELQTDDAWRPTPRILGAYPIAHFQKVFVETLNVAGLEFERRTEYDARPLCEDPGRAIYRGRFFTTFALLMRRHGPAGTRFPVALDDCVLRQPDPAPATCAAPTVVDHHSRAAAGLPPPRVHVVVSDRGWILEDCARQLAERLDYVTVGSEPDTEAHINYYMNYLAFRGAQPGVNVGFFTHEEERIPEVAEAFWLAARGVDVRVCMSERYADRLRARGLQDVHLIRPGVDLERFQPLVRIGVVGRTYATGRKGEDLIRQVMDLPGIEWHFTGTGWPGPSVRYPPERMPDFYNGIDYLLVASHYEGGPMPALEALACGRPVIAPPVGFVPSFPHLEFHAGDAGSLRQVLEAVVRERQVLRASVTDTTWDAWAAGHDRLFRSLATRVPPDALRRTVPHRASAAPPDQPRKLEIGSGWAPHDGYEHLDVRGDLPHVEHVHDFKLPLPFADESYDEILAWSCLEHAPWRTIAATLADWRRVLKPGGVLEIWVPDLEYLCRSYLAGQADDNLDPAYVRDAERLLSGLTPSTWAVIKMFGGQDYADNFHMSGFDWTTLSRLLGLAGFERIERRPPFNGLHVRAVRDHVTDPRGAQSGPARQAPSPAVSIVMCTHNAARHLTPAIRSILSQTLTDFEFIIVNDGSTDSTDDILGAVVDPRVRVLQSDCNQGLTRSLNAACRRARGRYIARMDSDDLSQPDRLRLQVSFLDQHREYGMVGSWFQVIDDGGKPSGPVVQCLVGNEAIKQHLLSTGNAFGHGSVMFRRELFETLGGYDETYRYSQDYDLWLRMAEKAKVENIPETLYWWRQTSEGISHLHATEQRACGERAREAAMARRLAAAKAAAERWRVEKDGLARMTCSCLRLLSRNKETLYIWGAGAAGLRAKCLLKQIHVDADAFLDSDPRKIGTTVGGLPVLSPACVAEPGRSVQSVGVVVASIAGDAIGKALEAAQHREGEDYVIIPQELLS